MKIGLKGPKAGVDAARMKAAIKGQRKPYGPALKRLAS
jgi:hypothetical protein